MRFLSGNVLVHIFYPAFFMNFLAPLIIQKTSNFIEDFDVKKSEDSGVPLSESINFDYLRH